MPYCSFLIKDPQVAMVQPVVPSELRQQDHSLDAVLGSSMGNTYLKKKVELVEFIKYNVFS